MTDKRRPRSAEPDGRRSPPSTSRRSASGRSRTGRRARRGFDDDAVEARRASVPTIRFPEELPVSQRRDEIAELIRDNQVVIVAGETGSGKTTQIPKICLELGRGVTAMIGHTQPRRLAARSVASRIAEELGTELGDTVGYAVRFTDQVSDRSLIKLMTDGILLAELQRDRDLSAYDTIIIDEAHERSLNIDFILGYLAQLLPRRPDLKVIVTSATIETERFAHHFARDGTPAPIVEVSGRTYPVEIRYRPLDPGEVPAPRRSGEAPAPRRSGEAPAPRDQITAITDAVDELTAEGPGDILVFLSGEREIHDTADALRAFVRDRGDLRDTEILPLYARLSSAEQHRVFAGHKGRRIVLATNVAETSLTVPGIRYVIDPGTARISRYSNRLKVQRLPIEAVSRASADQRAGRCGRVAAGICIRLYPQDDYDQRDAFTEPEMLRTNLASVLLQMISIGLGDIARFPFLDPPDTKAVADGIRLLQELGALDTKTDPGVAARTGEGTEQLTDIGRQLARLPVDPRFARMVIEAQRNGCLREVLVIAAALSIQDPRERPKENPTAADQHHARFKDPNSDFMSYWKLWTYLRARQRELSSNQFRRLCRTEHLNYLRVREWQDVHAQLRTIASDLGMRQQNRDADAELIHRSLLAGLLSHIGVKDRDSREFIGARQARFGIGRGSAVATKAPPWVMASELVDTGRLWARTVARIEPEWAEQVGRHLTRHSFGEPHWSTKRGAAMVHERVTLYGLPIVADRVVSYAQIDPDQARELFVRHALVEGDWADTNPVVTANRDLVAEVAEIEHRFRRTDLVAGEDRLEELYLARIGDHVVSARSFDGWWRKARRDDPDVLRFTVADFLEDDTDHLDEDDFPEWWYIDGIPLPVTYAFSPGAVDDGVTVHIPVNQLNQIDPVPFDWQVPGLRAELLGELLRSLPKEARRALSPISEHTARFLATAEADDLIGTESLLSALRRELPRQADEWIDIGDIRTDAVAEHLRVDFVVTDAEGRIIAEGRDLRALQNKLAGKTRGAIAGSLPGVERTGATTWDFGSIERVVERDVDGLRVRGYPALADEGDTVGVRLLATEAQQRRIMWRGTRRLLRLTLPPPGRRALDGLSNEARLALGSSPYATTAALLDDATTTALDNLVRHHGGPAWNEPDFARLRDAVRRALDHDVRVIITSVGAILTAARALDDLLAEPVGEALWPAFDDVTAQRTALVHDGFIAAAGADRLDDVARYLQGAWIRLDRLRTGQTETLHLDRRNQTTVDRVQARYGEVFDRTAAGSKAQQDLVAIGWMIEELRISLFAQQVGTPQPVSEQRIVRALDDLARTLP